MPITAHSSWRDCCVAVISPVGGGRAAAESLHKNSSPVAPGPRETVCTCVCLCERLEYLWVLSHQRLCTCVFCALLTCSPGLCRASFITPTQGSHLPTSISQTAPSKRGKKNHRHRIDYHFTAGPHKPCVCNH